MFLFKRAPAAAFEYYYDGTRWLSTQRYTQAAAIPSASVSATTLYNLPYPGRTLGADIYIESFTALLYQTTGATDANYFVATLQHIGGSGAVTALGAGLSSQNMTLNNRLTKSEAINAVVSNASTEAMMVRYDETGTAVLTAPSALFTYRLIG